MNDSVYTLSLDIHEHASQAVLKAKKTDTGRKLHITLRAGGTPYTIANDCEAVFKATKPDRTDLFNNCTIENNEIIYEFTEQTCTSVGRCKCEIALYGPDGKIITSPRFSLLVDGTIYPDEIVESTDEFSELTKLITDTLEATHAATQAAQNADDAAKKADQAANDANDAINKYGDHPIKFIDNTTGEVKTVLHELPEGAYMLTGFFPYTREHDEEGIYFSNDLVSVEKYEAEDSVVVQFLVGRYLHSANISSNHVDYEKIPLRNLENKENRATTINENSDDEHYPTAKATWDAIKNQSGSSSGGQGTNYERFFKIDNAGLVSLKPEYRGCPAKNTYPDSISNNGIGVDGSKINELPEVLVIPDVINGITVLALSEGMFSTNYRVKSVTLPAGLTTLPKMVFNSTINLTEVKNTENIEVICQAAFQRCAIEKAMFPNLKAFEGAGQFNMAPKMVIADIGNTVTSIPQNCFSFCEALSCVRGGANVTHIGPKAFIFTYALRSLSFLRQVTFIDWEAFTLSSVTGDGTRDFNWWDFKDNSGCQFGTHPSTGACNATPAHINTTEWFTGCTLPTKCVVNDLGVTFNQANPEFATISLPNSHDTYGSGCLELSATHIYSALTGDALISTAEFWKNTGVYPGTNSPRVFVESIIANAKNSDGGSLLAPSGNGEDGPYYIIGDMGKWLGAMGLQCELLSGSFNKNNLNRIYQEVETGALAIFSYSYAYNGKSGGHAVVICGVADNGDLFILDSNSYKSEIKDYTSNVFRVPPLCFSGANILIVKK